MYVAHVLAYSNRIVSIVSGCGVALEGGIMFESQLQQPFEASYAPSSPVHWLGANETDCGQGRWSPETEYCVIQICFIGPLGTDSTVYVHTQNI